MELLTAPATDDGAFPFVHVFSIRGRIVCDSAPAQKDEKGNCQSAADTDSPPKRRDYVLHPARAYPTDLCRQEKEEHAEQEYGND